MKKLLLILLCTIPGWILPAQEDNQNLMIIDSLYQLYLQAEPGYDQIDYLIGISRLYALLADQTSFRKTIDMARKIAVETNDLAGQSNVKIMENIQAYMYEHNSDKALRLCQEAIDLAQSSGDPDALAFAMYQQAENYIYEKGDNARAITILRKSIRSFDDRVTVKNQGNSYKNLAVALRNIGQHDEALHYFELSLQAFEKVASDPDDHHRLGRVSAMYADKGLGNLTQALVYLAETQDALGRLAEAEATLLKAYNLSNEGDIQDTHAWICGKLGVLFDKRGAYQQALTYLQEGLLIFEELEVDQDVAQLQVHLGDVFRDLEDYEQANLQYEKSRQYYLAKKDTLRYLHVSTQQIGIYLTKEEIGNSRQALEECREMAHQFGDSASINFLIRQFANLYRLTGEYDEAAGAIRQVLDFSRSRADQQSEARALTDLAGIYVLQDKRKAAMEACREALDLSQKAGRGDLISDNLKLMSEIEESSGNYQSALSFFHQLYEHEKSLELSEAQEILRAEQVRQNVNEYKSAEEAAVVQANLLASRNRLYLGFAILLFAFLVVGLYLNSRLRKAKALLESKNKQLAELNHTKDRFFSIIAHDIRSPIVALEGVGEQVKYYLKKDHKEKLEGIADKIGSTAKSLTRLLDNLLNWALIQQGMLPNVPDRICMNRVFDEVIQMFEMHASVKEITIRNTLTENIYVQVDERALNIILRNLISNALKFTERGGTIEIGAIASDNSVVKVYVNDTGIGMDQEKLNALFTLSGKNNTGTGGEKGTGLGLILCKELVELNQGRLEIDSKIDQGSNILFTLPRAA
ncbi:MAG: tetratricopeptide repeat protein [Saprospiraceae bacterium]|nr:tetratricopeptide repeat protein [Saprospiraceae bacterium]